MKVNGVFSKISERNWKILLILMVCVFSVIVYISMSVVYWREVDESIVKSQLSTKDILVKLQSDDFSHNTIYQVKESLDNTTNCKGNFLFNWQSSFIERIKSKMNKCTLESDRLSRHKEAVYSLVHQMDKESNLSTILAEATNKLHNIKNTEYHKCKQIWREVIESTNKISEISGSGIANSVISKSQKLITAYDKLEKYDNEQNFKLYNSAMDEVAQIYSEIVGLQIQAIKEYDEKVSDLIKSYKV